MENQPVYVRLKTEQIAILDAEASKRDWSRSMVIKEAIQDWLKAHKAEAKAYDNSQ